MGNHHPFHHHLTLKQLIFLVLIPLLLSGCANLAEVEQPATSSWETVSSGRTVGQTFVAKYDGLAGIFFYLSPQTAGNGQVSLHLRSSAQAAEDLAISENVLPIAAVKTPGFYGFFVPAQAASNQVYYYAYLEVTGSGGLQVGKTAGSAYLNGALYQNGSPEDAQAAFELSYSRRKAFLGLGLEGLTWLWILTICLFLFVVPGWGLFSLLWPGWGRLAWPEKMGLSAGLSVALYPLLLLWTNLVGLHLGPLYAWFPPIAGAAVIAWRNRGRLKGGPLKPSNLFAFLRRSPYILPDGIFLVILALLVFTRFWAIRSLDLPMWGDSYQHTMIAQLIVDHGGLFSNWQPYADLTTFTYHFGFHAAVAVFDWITHLDVSKAVLWVGQLMNLLAVIVLYPLATKVGRSRWAGVAAVLAAGLLSPMPMGYVNWGRYTQLAGQVILPVCAWVTWTLLAPDPSADGKPIPIGSLVVGWLIFSGLALTHYRVMILALICLAVLWILYARRDTLRSMFIKTLWIGAGAFLLFLPWFIRVFSGRIVHIFSTLIATSAKQVIESEPQLGSIGNISMYLPTCLWLAIVAGIGIGLWQREKGILLIFLWWFLNFLAGNPTWLGLPGAGVVSGFAINIAMYIPAGILVGAMAGWIANSKRVDLKIAPHYRPAFILAIIILFTGAGLWGLQKRIKDVQPAANSLITRPDISAAAWIKKNTPPSARFLVNSFHAFNDSVIVGSDGGWWLPLLAGRQTTLPPLSYSFEKDPWPGYSAQAKALTAEIQSKGIQDPEVLSLLKSRGISYLYIGQLQGRVNSAGPLFTPGQILEDSNFHMVYHQDRVWIFQF